MPHDIKSQMLDVIDNALDRVGDAPSEARFTGPLKQARAIIEAVPPYRPCRLCADCVPAAHLATGKTREFCTTWKTEIPPEWLDVGCDQWFDVPF